MRNWQAQMAYQCSNRLAKCSMFKKAFLQLQREKEREREMKIHFFLFFNFNEIERDGNIEHTLRIFLSTTLYTHRSGDSRITDNKARKEVNREKFHNKFLGVGNMKQALTMEVSRETFNREKEIDTLDISFSPLSWVLRLHKFLDVFASDLQLWGSKELAKNPCRIIETCYGLKEHMLKTALNIWKWALIDREAVGLLQHISIILSFNHLFSTDFLYSNKIERDGNIG